MVLRPATTGSALGLHSFPSPSVEAQNPVTYGWEQVNAEEADSLRAFGEAKVCCGADGAGGGHHKTWAEVKETACA